MEMNTYDIATIGSGIACSMTLCELAERLKGTPAGSKTLRICVIEKEREVWKGVPYGGRSATGALAFQRLQDFLEEPERSCYIEWLVANADSWLRAFEERGGPSAVKWISDNQLSMEQGNWGELYLPRFLFGMYVAKKTARAVEELSKGRLAIVTVIHAEATAVSRLPGKPHAIAVQDSTGTRTLVHAAKVVLAIGSPPQKPIYGGFMTGRHHHTHIDNLYSPSEDFNIQKLHDALSSLTEKKLANILIVGSNASALEVLYLINYRPDIRSLINSVVVFSRTGLLPYKICQERIAFQLTALETLSGATHVSAADLMAAITSDIQRAVELRLNIADLCDPVGVAVSKVTARLPLSEQKKFVCEHGVNFSRMMRRAGRDTRTAADELSDAGVLTIVKGDFRRLEPMHAGNGLASATYAPAGCEAETTHPVPFSISLNCGGFEELDFCSSQLINSLIDNQLCKVNSTRRGFLINDRLEASENLYVIGPLVGGNFNDRVRFWHVESASRIAGLAKLLAESLHSSIFSANESPISHTTRLPSMTSSVCPSSL